MKSSLYIKNFLLHSGAIALLRPLDQHKAVAILRYHAIVDPSENYYANPSICLAPDLFEKQVGYFSRNYNIISLDEVADCIKTQNPFPKNSVVFTFDDGYRDNFLAFKILKKYGATGTFYIATSCIDNAEPLWLAEVLYLTGRTKKTLLSLQLKGEKCSFRLESPSLRMQAATELITIIKSNDLQTRETIRKSLREQTSDVSDYAEKMSRVMLSWEQIKEMSDHGMAIGGHTMTHLNLPNANRDDVVDEISGCKRIIEEKTGRPARHFSYPNGGRYEYYNPEILSIVKEAGYVTSTTSKNGLSTLQSHLFELERVRITDHLSEALYQIECEPIINRLRR